MESQEIFLTIEEVAAELHISVGTARNRLSCKCAPMPPSIKIGRRRLFPRRLFSEWLRKLSVEQIPGEMPDEPSRGRGRPRKTTETEVFYD
ncbi:MAG: hypothetical protein B6D73_10790 [gamma proteobacterium symbiont of Stewartia floridana]|nr:MAG: hypothetical protein B6D73_10790 [gamma proteobacterium symbiont of Stewartia floridana]